MKHSFDETLNRLVRRLSAEYDIDAPPEAPQARFSSFPLHCGPDLCTFPCLSVSLPSSLHSPYSSPAYHHHYRRQHTHTHLHPDTHERQDGEGEGEGEEDEVMEQQQKQEQQQYHQQHHQQHHQQQLQIHQHHPYGATKRLSQSQHENFIFLLSRKTEYRQNQHSLPLASYSILHNVVATFGKLLEYQIQRMIYNIMSSTSEDGASEEDKEILRKFTDLPMGMGMGMGIGNSDHRDEQSNNRLDYGYGSSSSSSPSSSLVIPELVYTNFSTMLPMEHWQEMGCDNVSLRLIFHAELTLRIVPDGTVHTASIRAPGITHGVFTSHMNHFGSATAGGTGNTNSNTRYGGVGGAGVGVGVGVGGALNTYTSTSRGNHCSRPESIEVDINTKALYNSIRRECKVISKKVVNAIVGFELKKIRNHRNLQHQQHQQHRSHHNYHQHQHIQHQPKVHKHHLAHRNNHQQHHLNNNHHHHHKQSATMNSDGVATYKTEKTAVSTVDGRSNASTIYYDDPTTSGTSSNLKISTTNNMDLASSSSDTATAGGIGMGAGMVKKSKLFPSDDITPKKKTSRSSAAAAAATTTKLCDSQHVNAAYHNENPQGSETGGGGGDITESPGYVDGVATTVFYDQEGLTEANMMEYSSNDIYIEGEGDNSGGNNMSLVGLKKKTKRKKWKRLISPQKGADKTDIRPAVEQTSSNENMTEDESVEKRSKKKNDHRWKALFTSSKQ